MQMTDNAGMKTFDLSAYPFHAAIRRLRLAANLTQTELAARAGVAIGTVNRIERGTARPTLPALAGLAAALGCELVVSLLGYRIVSSDR